MKKLQAFMIDITRFDNLRDFEKAVEYQPDKMKEARLTTSFGHIIIEKTFDEWMPFKVHAFVKFYFKKEYTDEQIFQEVQNVLFGSFMKCMK